MLRTVVYTCWERLWIGSLLSVDMKIKRQKQAKKTISFYKYSFNLREPFQILIDGTFCQAALKNKIQIKEQLPKYLMGEVQLCTTTWVHHARLPDQPESPDLLLCSSCAMKELECLGKELYGAKIILQKYQTRRCAHTGSPVPAAECLLSMLGEHNPHHYFIATQVHLEARTRTKPLLFDKVALGKFFIFLIVWLLMVLEQRCMKWTIVAYVRC